jgi:hypothetical protein
MEPAKLPPPPSRRPSPLGPPAQAEPTPTAPVPELRPIFTPQQQQELDRLISERIGRARQTLRSIEGHPLTKSQSATVNQIRTFILQATEARKRDPVRAGNLAERADVLARDLLRSLP